jgi:hypothetical protein
MKKTRALRYLRWFAFGVIALGLVAAVLVMLPGPIEGQYHGIGVGCGCDSFNFLQYRDGKIVSYMSAHPPARLIGRYSLNPDGSVDLYLRPFKDGETEEFVGRANPRLLLTRFVWSDGETEWAFKCPKILTVRRTIETHEITSKILHDDKTITTTYYNSSLEPLRQETTPPKKPRTKPPTLHE